MQQEDKITALATAQDTIVTVYRDLSVHNAVSLAYASEALSNIRIYLRKVEATRVEMVKPFNDGVKALNARAHALMAPVKELDNSITQKIKDYRAMVEAQRVKEQKRLDAEAQANLTEDALIPEAIALIVRGQSKTLQTLMGKITFVNVRKWRLVNLQDVPREYFILDEAKITKLVKGGIDHIPGIQMYWEEIPQVRQ